MGEAYVHLFVELFNDFICFNGHCDLDIKFGSSFFTRISYRDAAGQATLMQRGLGEIQNERGVY